MTQSPVPQQQQQQQRPEDKKRSSQYVEKLADWIVDIIAFPVSFVSYVLSRFLTPGSSGTRILGGIGFLTGTLLSTDGIWQTLFQGVPLFPWYESSWIGWFNWLGLTVNGFFWLSFSMSALVQVMQARSLRGKSPEMAKNELEKNKVYALGAKPTGGIDLVQALWGDYKRAGMKERSAGGAIALFFWVFDFTTTFVGRNPFRYSDPAQIVGCIAYNLITMMAGEIGFTIWKLTK